MGKVFEEVLGFKRRYPGTVAWRLSSHSKVVEKHLNPDEEVLYVFAGQRNNEFYNIITTSVFVITNKRLLIGQKRLLFGYFLYSITPDMFNDLTIYSGLFWGKVSIDTINEQVYVSNLSKRSLDEIETKVTQYMMEEKKEYMKGISK